MRVIAGKYKGLVIPMPKKGAIRPTTDRSKEALFSIINSRFDLDTCRVLDLFGGSGNIALEFASRGALAVTSVEKNRPVQRQCVEFVKTKGITEINFKAADVFTFLKRETETYDIIFADPPYHLDRIAQLPDLIREKSMLSDEGVLIIEHHATLTWDNKYLAESRSYGQSVFSFFQFPVSLDE